MPSSSEQRPTIHVQTLGGFSIRTNGCQINDNSNQSKKPWALLEYLVIFQKKDIKRRPPDWCPQRLKTSVCRIYGFRDALQESLDLDYRLALKLEKADWCFPMGHRYVLRHEFPLGMTAEKFYAAVQELVVDEVLNGTPVRNGELIEIDDGLAPYFFYVYNQATVLPAKVFGLKKEDHDET